MPATRPYAAYDAYMNDVRAKGEGDDRAGACREGRRIIVLVGRPYHVDPEINHGIDKLIAGLRRGRRHGGFPSPGICRSRHRACSTSGRITPGCTPPRATSPPSGI